MEQGPLHPDLALGTAALATSLASPWLHQWDDVAASIALWGGAVIVLIRLPSALLELRDWWRRR